MASSTSARPIRLRPRPGTSRSGAKRADRGERGRPVGEVSVAAIRRGAELHGITREQDLLFRQPHDRVARCVAAPDVDDLYLAASQPERHALMEDEIRPGQAGDALLAAEQARKAADLAIHVLLAPLDDQVAGDI